MLNNYNDLNYSFLQTIKELISEIKINSYEPILTKTYWTIGCLIAEEEQKGNYDNKELYLILLNEFSENFSMQDLLDMRQFSQIFPNLCNGCSKLTWQHYKELMLIESESARTYYVQEAINKQWCVEELKQIIKDYYYYMWVYAT